MDKTWLQFSSLSGLQIIFSSYSSIKNWNLSLMLNKYSRKTKPQLLNKPTGSFKWIQIFSMWTQSNFRHFSLLICWAMQRRRERALEALCQIVTQTTSNVEEILSAAPFSNPQLWYACASLFFLTDIRPNTAENLKLKFHHDRQEARTMNLRNDLKQKWEGEHWSSSCYKHRTGPSLQIAALTWHCRACSVSKDLGQSLFSHIPDVPGFPLLFWQMLPLTQSSPLPCPPSPIPLSLPAAPQCSRVTQGRKSWGTCQPASHGLGEHSRKTPGNKSN